LFGLGRFGDERLRDDGLCRWRLRAVNGVFTVRDVSLGSKFSEFALAEGAGDAVVRSRRNLRGKLVDLLLSAAILHDVIHFSGNLNGFLELV